MISDKTNNEHSDNELCIKYIPKPKMKLEI